MSLFDRLKQGLGKTRQEVSQRLTRIFEGKTFIDDDLYDELEEALFQSDIGFEATDIIMENLRDSVRRNRYLNTEELYGLLKKEIVAIAEDSDDFDTRLHGKTPAVILVVGVNGVGKTTTIGKLALHYNRMGKKVMLAAGDTFRAAATKQLQIWAQRADVPIVAQHEGADSASVIFDALESATKKGYDLVIADTAGRLHNKSNLMDELKKIQRVMKKIIPEAPHEVLLVLDATTGQNAIAQSKVFYEECGATGLVLTKLDGTARGGVVLAVRQQFKLPIRFIGVGEGVEDLQPFNAIQFANALLDN